MTKFRKSTGLLIIHKSGHSLVTNENRGQVEPLYPAGIEMEQTKLTDTRPSMNSDTQEPLYPTGIVPKEAKEDDDNLLLPTFFSEK